jgi:hypothetical protein
MMEPARDLGRFAVVFARACGLEIMAYAAQAAFEKSSQPFDVEKLVKTNRGIRLGGFVIS